MSPQKGGAKMDLVVEPDGTVRCIYDEAISLTTLGHVTIRRGSHVEPYAGGGWTADLGPVRGPILGPFATRSEALEAETEWLRSNWL